ncbi:MAG: RodZ domain-containing protein [Anaerolineales bacterium]
MNASVGDQLRQAREERSLSLEQVAHATHMRVHYLRALESNDLESIPSLAQARGFLRAYAGFLGLDARPLLADMFYGESPPDKVEKSEHQPDEDRTEEVEEGGSAAVFIEIGESLQRQREMLGLSIEDVERHTHLRRHYILALEAGDLDGLPSPVQGRGMLNNYAAFLGMDADRLLLRFADGLQMRHAVRYAGRVDTRPISAAPSSPSTGGLRRLISADLLVVLVVSIGMIAFFIWGAGRIFSMQSEIELTPTAPSIADVLLATATPSLTFTPQPVTPTSVSNVEQFSPGGGVAGSAGEEGLPPGGAGGVQVYVVVHQRAWMRVIVDGETEFEGRVIPDSAYNFAGEATVEVLTGNGLALQVFYDQADLGRLGVYGQVVRQVYTAEGIVTPTPTITLTPTVTLPATPTPTLTPTSQAVEETAPPFP